MHPDQKQVIPLMPEEISNSDGQEKQDCELNAAKRFIPKIYPLFTLHRELLLFHTKELKLVYYIFDAINKLARWREN